MVRRPDMRFVEKSEPPRSVNRKDSGQRRFHGRVVLLVKRAHTASAVGNGLSSSVRRRKIISRPSVGTKTPGRLLSGSAYRLATDTFLAFRLPLTSLGKDGWLRQWHRAKFSIETLARRVEGRKRHAARNRSRHCESFVARRVAAGHLS